MLDNLKLLLEGNNFWINVIFLVLAIVGIVSTFITFIIGRRTRIVQYNSKTIKLLSERLKGIQEISIKFEDEEIPTFSTSVVSIWNSGNEIVNHSDFATKEPLRIQSNNPNFKIYMFEIENVVNPSNQEKWIPKLYLYQL